MKKTLIALAAVAVSSAAVAQVTISGNLAYSYQQDITSTTANPVFAGSTSTAPTTATLTAGTAKGFALNQSDIRFAATEDLGGGMRAAADFTWETGFQRGSFASRGDAGISLSGGFGSVAIRNTRHSDLIAGIASSAISLPDGVYENGIVGRSGIDTVTYTLPALVKGLTLAATYSEANDGNINLPTTNAKSAFIYNAQYATGPLTVRATLKQFDLTTTSVTAVKSQQEFAVLYNAGFATIAYATDGKDNTDTTKAGSKVATGYSITVPMGAISLGAQSFNRDNIEATNVGVKYDLSKRTAFTLAQGTTKGASVNGKQYRVRLAHSF